MAMINYQVLAATLPFDINAEALAGSLLDHSAGLAGPDQILVRPMGPVNRAGGAEVMQVTGAVYNAEGQELVYIDINREGLYDALPDMLFLHQENTYEDAVAQAQDLARQQESARRFFLPFEEVLYQSRIAVEQAERTAIKHLAGWLLQLYGLSAKPEAGVQANQMLSLALALPFLDQVVGDFSRMSQFLTAILRQPVTVSPGRPQPYRLPEAHQAPLGAGTLGVDMLLGDSFTDGIRTLQVCVGALHPAQITDWLPGGGQRRLLEEQLLPYVVPAGEQVNITIGITRAECQFVLGDTESALSFLGYTTIIE
jgi:hypothetical protein